MPLIILVIQRKGHPKEFVHVRGYIWKLLKVHFKLLYTKFFLWVQLKNMVWCYKCTEMHKMNWTCPFLLTFKSKLLLILTFIKLDFLSLKNFCTNIYLYDIIEISARVEISKYKRNSCFQSIFQYTAILKFETYYQHTSMWNYFFDHSLFEKFCCNN